MAKVVTITNPVTGQPAQVDQLDHTAQQIDDAVEAARWSHRNLLDNAYWANADAIIDQRGGYVVPPGVAYAGESSGTTTKYYTVKSTYIYNDVKYAVFDVDGSECNVPFYACVRGYTGAGYGIDRWDLFGGTNPTMLIENGHIRLTGSGYFRQIIPVSQIPRGTLVTFSILMASGELYSLTTTVPDNQVDSPQVFFPGGFLRIFGWNADTDVYFIWFDGEVSPVAMKLELGDTQTLAHQDKNGNWVLNEIPDYGEQLRRCQRYFERVYLPNSFIGFAIRPNAIFFNCTYKVQKRTNPSIIAPSMYVVRASDHSGVYGSEVYQIPNDILVSTDSCLLVFGQDQVNAIAAGGFAYLSNHGNMHFDVEADL